MNKAGSHTVATKGGKGTPKGSIHSPPAPLTDPLQPQSLGSHAKLIFLRIQLQNPFKSEMFKEAGWRDHLLPCHSFVSAGTPVLALHSQGSTGRVWACHPKFRTEDRIWPHSKLPEVKAVTESASEKGMQCPLATGSSISHQLSPSPPDPIPAFHSAPVWTWGPERTCSRRAVPAGRGDGRREEDIPRSPSADLLGTFPFPAPGHGAGLPLLASHLPSLASVMTSLEEPTTRPSDLLKEVDDFYFDY